MKKLTIGILAHVDAGKTTLSEAMLYLSKAIRKQGRVDHGDSFLDTDAIERARGITVYSKEARFSYNGTEFTLVDTPGHVDFSAEAERAIPVLDYAILLISAPSGIQNHTETIWQLLKRYKIPTFVFVNKMDISAFSSSDILASLRRAFDGSFIELNMSSQELFEELALVNEAMLEEYSDRGEISSQAISRAIAMRELFPVYFGSALKNDGVEAMLQALASYTLSPRYRDAFSAKVFKITRDERGQRLTHMKITGGALRVRDTVSYTPRASLEAINEKISQIRFYNGNKFEASDIAIAGDVCAVTGLSASYASEGLGDEPNSPPAMLEPVLSCRVKLPPEVDAKKMLPKLKLLEEEFPELNVTYKERLSEISLRLMGEIQTDTLKRVIRDRFDTDVEFDDGEILYKESITGECEGIGHFEPLRHYAEVHLKLEALPRGSGIVIASDCSDKLLPPSWQRLVLTHLTEKQHLGVLTGSPITDIKLTLIAGRAHVKHTDGGDFREATYRAVRNGLMRATSVLLEPIYAFKLEIPKSDIGRAITDIRNMSGSFDAPLDNGDTSILIGRAPVSEMRSYIREINSYTRGKGKLQCIPDGYDICHDTEKAVERIAYDPEADLANTPDSVFCAKGAGFTVKWYDVKHYMDIDSGFSSDSVEPEKREAKLIYRSSAAEEAELEAIMQREFGPIRRKSYTEKKIIRPNNEIKLKESRKKYFIIDGYNVIHSWDALKSVAEIDLEGSRKLLIDIIINYSAYTDNRCMIVFDAYNIKAQRDRRESRSGVSVVYTKENETADAYIEKAIHDIGKSYDVRVVTSDALIQISALSVGMLRMSSSEFEKEIEKHDTEINEILQRLAHVPKAKLSELISALPEAEITKQ